MTVYLNYIYLSWRIPKQLRAKKTGYFSILVDSSFIHNGTFFSPHFETTDFEANIELDSR